jgi:hypothetical protein
VIPYSKKNAWFVKVARFRVRASDHANQVVKAIAIMAIGFCLVGSVHVITVQSSTRDPVALVIEKSGQTSPELQTYSEIMAGDAFEVPSGSSLVFIDYRSCNRVTVSGATVRFWSGGFSTSQGARRSDQRVACPQNIGPDSGGENSSVLMRGLDILPSVANRPDFVIISGPGRGFTRASVKDATRILVDTELHGARFDWPASAPPLAADEAYELVLLPERADDHPVKFSFKAAEDSPGNQPAIVLIHAGR